MQNLVNLVWLDGNTIIPGGAALARVSWVTVKKYIPKLAVIFPVFFFFFFFSSWIITVALWL